jgi:hypothetical protein
VARSVCRLRTKENIADVRHLYIDLDADGEAGIAAFLASDTVPAPNVILATSPNKYQAVSFAQRIPDLQASMRER